jgi:RNA polymerase sigma-70 factor (ECF subfamily)
LRVKTTLAHYLLPLQSSRCACGATDHNHSASLLDDGALVRALVAGERDAWSEFMRRYEPGIRRCITSVVSRFRRVVSSEDEQEIFSDFCVRILQHDRSKLEAFDPSRGCSLATWLGMVAIQTARDHLRRRRRDSYRDYHAEIDTFESNSENPYEQCLRHERAELARVLLDSFTERDREFIGRLCSDAFEAEDVARQMGISVGTVYTKKHKLVGRLTRLLEASQPTAA